MLSPVKIEELNIILITVDTLRADHLECYGYDRIKTPQINRLANEGSFTFLLFGETVSEISCPLAFEI